MELGERQHAEAVVYIQQMHDEGLTGPPRSSELQQVSSLQQALHIQLCYGESGGRDTVYQGWSDLHVSTTSSLEGRSTEEGKNYKVWKVSVQGLADSQATLNFEWDKYGLLMRDQLVM